MGGGVRQRASPWLFFAAVLAEPAAARAAEPAQARATEPAEPMTAAVAQPAAPVPDGFDERRRLGPEEYENKAEGGYFTGLPLVNYDTNTGVGFGARAYYYFDGERTDPRFAYTPYLYRAFLQAFATTGGYQFHWLDLDARNIFGSAFTFRGQLIYQYNTDQHYFGIGARSMGRLSFSGSAQSYRRYADYQAALDTIVAGQTRARYDSYRLAQPLLLLSVERPLLRGLLRPMLGLGFSHSDIENYAGQRVSVDVDGDEVRATQGPTRLSEDCAAGVITGCRGGYSNYLRLGIAFDTRDFEPDPNRGVFIDLALDLGTRLLGSGYDWARVMLAPRGYLSLLPGLTDLVGAARATLVVQSSDTPFFGMNMIPYVEDPRQGLGGLRTLRGFKQDRFVGPVMTLFNPELRWTLLRTPAFGQTFAWTLVPFIDLGAVHDRVGDLGLSGWRRDQGAALRVAWNLATIITVEYAASDEDSGFYVNFGHIF
jgi:outer membrane protein assembly factor BamA